MVSHADIISMATVTKIRRLWIWLGHVPVNMCMSACVYLSVCMGACARACVRTHIRACMYGYQKYVFVCSYGIYMCLCMSVAIRWIFLFVQFLVCSHITPRIWLSKSGKQWHSLDTYVLYSLLLFSTGQMRCLILHLQKKFLILRFILTQIKYFWLNLFIWCSCLVYFNGLIILCDNVFGLARA